VFYPFLLSMHENIIKIDGSLGEGGGQILRTALSLSTITQRPFEIYNIRANRKTPGLSHQHLQAVNATARICNAKVSGNYLRSTDITFYPGKVQYGNYRFDIGTAGSVSLVLQTIFYPLSLAGEKSTITITGGTHVTHSPCIDYLACQWLYFLKQIGFDAKIQTVRAGFYPRGGGEVFVEIHPANPQLPLEIKDRGRHVKTTVISAVSNLDMAIAQRQQLQAKKRLQEKGIPHEVVLEERPAIGKGTLLLIVGTFEHSQCCYFSLGAIGKRAETVADDACNEFLSFLGTKGVIDEHLADQIVIPLALTKGTSHFITPKITQHLLTNIEIVKLFLPVSIDISGTPDGEGAVTIQRF